MGGEVYKKSFFIKLPQQIAPFGVEKTQNDKMKWTKI